MRQLSNLSFQCKTRKSNQNTSFLEMGNCTKMVMGTVSKSHWLASTGLIVEVEVSSILLLDTVANCQNIIIIHVVIWKALFEVIYNVIYTVIQSYYQVGHISKRHIGHTVGHSDEIFPLTLAIISLLSRDAAYGQNVFLPQFFFRTKAVHLLP